MEFCSELNLKVKKRGRPQGSAYKSGGKVVSFYKVTWLTIRKPSLSGVRDDDACRPTIFGSKSQTQL